MLVSALAATVPIVTVKTTDTVYSPDYLCWLATEPILNFGTRQISKTFTKEFLESEYRLAMLFAANIHADFQDEFHEFYETLDNANKGVILVNPNEHIPLSLDCGTLEFSTSYIVETLKPSYPTIDEFVDMLHNLTVVEADTVCRMTYASAGLLDRSTLQKFRRIVEGEPPGLYLYTGQPEFYRATKKFKEWANLWKKPFLTSEDKRFRPRGLLFDGEPGTGKTAGAKWLAAQWGVPLYRLEVASMMSKWLGESEQNLNVALSRIEDNAPCVVIIDEVEKLFTQSEDGASGRILSRLLWWLQEHTARVVTIMTTNDRQAIPKELYRPGRIDGELKFFKIKGADIQDFVLEYLKTFELDDDQESSIWGGVCKYLRIGTSDERYASTGELVHLVNRLIAKLTFD